MKKAAKQQRNKKNLMKKNITHVDYKKCIIQE